MSNNLQYINLKNLVSWHILAHSYHKSRELKEYALCCTQGQAEGKGVWEPLDPCALGPGLPNSQFKSAPNPFCFNPF